MTLKIWQHKALTIYKETKIYEKEHDFEYIKVMLPDRICQNSINDINNEGDNNYQMKIKEYMDNNSICIGLLASVIPGGGTKLIKKLIKDAKDNNIDNIYLWTDETCNYSYYEKFRFKVVEEYDVKFFDKVIKTYIYMLDLKK